MLLVLRLPGAARRGSSVNGRDGGRGRGSTNELIMGKNPTARIFKKFMLNMGEDDDVEEGKDGGRDMSPGRAATADGGSRSNDSTPFSMGQQGNADKKPYSSRR